MALLPYIKDMVIWPINLQKNKQYTSLTFIKLIMHIKSFKNVRVYFSLCNSLKSQSADYTPSIKNLHSYCSSHHECPADFQIPRLTSVQFSSVAQSCPALCTPMDCSTPGPLVHHQRLELTQIHVHWASDAIQPSHLLSSPSPLAFNLSQHQGLFKWVSCLHQVAKVLEFQLQRQSFLWIFRIDLL